MASQGKAGAVTLCAVSCPQRVTIDTTKKLVATVKATANVTNASDNFAFFTRLTAIRTVIDQAKDTPRFLPVVFTFYDTPRRRRYPGLHHPPDI